MKTRMLLIGLLMLLAQIAIVRAEPTTQPASQPTSQPVVITWDSAKSHVGDTVTTTGPVMGTHVVGATKFLILNVGKDYPDKARLSVLIQAAVDEGDYQGKTITVTGKVEMFKGSPEIKVAPQAVTINK